MLTDYQLCSYINSSTTSIFPCAVTFAHRQLLVGSIMRFQVLELFSTAQVNVTHVLFIYIHVGLDDQIEILSIPGIGAQSEKRRYSNVEAFRSEVIDEKLPRQRFTVSREDGMEELKKDILSHYKDNKCKLVAKTVCHV